LQASEVAREVSHPRPRGLSAITLAIVVTVAACSNAAGWSPGPDARESASAASAAPSAALLPSALATVDAVDSAPISAASPTTPASVQPSTPAPSPKATPGSWTLDVYDARAVLWQNPDVTACTAASALMMLNMAAYWQYYSPVGAGEPEPVPPHGWKPDVSYARQESILAYQRRTGTMLLTWPGADAHGWRNSLNYYGWGSATAGVYRDEAFDSFAAAARATVTAIALYRKPVGILSMAGNHAQIVTGYRVTGDDPRTGTTAFSVVGVYLTDPLRADGFRDQYVSLATWKSGAKTIRFTPYLMTNSPYVDPIDGKQGNAEWDGKWVIIAPVL
jgi:hypothetical protein